MKEKISNAILKLKEYSVSLNESNLKEFEMMKASIEEILDEKRRIIFSQIEFYKIIEDAQNDDDILPF